MDEFWWFVVWLTGLTYCVDLIIAVFVVGLFVAVNLCCAVVCCWRAVFRVVVYWFVGLIV